MSEKEESVKTPAVPDEQQQQPITAQQQQNIESVFGIQDKDNTLRNAQKQRSDFKNFFRDNRKSEKLQKYETEESIRKKQELSLKRMKEEIINEKKGHTGKNGEKVYRKDEKVDGFLNKIIIGRGLTKPEKIDHFLQNSSNWANLGQTIPIQKIIHEKNMTDPDYSLHYGYQQSKMNNTSIGNNNSSLPGSTLGGDILNSTGNKSVMQQSYAFSGPPRFWLSKNKNSTGKTHLNELVCESTRSKHDTKYFDSIINDRIKIENTKSLQDFCQKQPDYLNSEDRIKEVLNQSVSPQEKRQEFADQKKKLMEYQNMKKQATYKQRQLGILKNNYRSGVISIDSPFVEDSKIYSNEFKKIRERQRSEQQFKQIRADNMGKFIVSHPDIDFTNRNRNNHRYDERHKKLFPHQSHEIDPIWQSRKTGKNSCQKLPTFENCFGHNLKDQKESIQNPRSQYLYAMDTRNKGFNPLTGCENSRIF